MKYQLAVIKETDIVSGCKRGDRKVDPCKTNVNRGTIPVDKKIHPITSRPDIRTPSKYIEKNSNYQSRSDP